jgi:KaiC/GvpD/RAD55 family RecA-like ATPase
MREHEHDSAAAEGTADADDADLRCDFCRMPIPVEPVEATVTGEPYVFCSRACRDALTRSEHAFTAYHGHRRIHPGVSALDASLPQGLPRNAFVLMSAEAGARDIEVQSELVWRTLQRGEPAVIVSFREPPGSVVQQFLTLEWNVLPYLESGQLHILDCFTYRLSNRDRMFDRMDEWNRHLYDVARDATTTIRDPSDLGELLNKLDNALEAREMVDAGIVLLDSLTELGTLVQPVQAYNFVKDVRADVCKGRFVPVFAGATSSPTDVETFPHDLGYVVDGIVEQRLNGDIVEDTLIKQIRIRKLNGVLVIPEWHAYEYTSGTGMVTFDPEVELEKSRGSDATAATADGDAADEQPLAAEADTPAPDGAAVEPGEDAEPAAGETTADGSGPA